MLSKALCGVQAYLLTPFSGYPLRLWLILIPEFSLIIEMEVESGPRCLLDLFTLAFYAVFRGRLRSEVVRKCLGWQLVLFQTSGLSRVSSASAGPNQQL